MEALDPAVWQAYSKMSKPFHTAKSVQSAACWNWALYGAVDPAPHVADLFAYINRDPNHDLQQRLRQDAETSLATSPSWASFRSDPRFKRSLDGMRASYDNFHDDEPTRNSMREAVFDLAIQSAGFTISETKTPYLIAMFEPNDTVMFDHWWLEIGGTVIETVTGQDLYFYSSQYLQGWLSFPTNRFAQRSKITNSKPERVSGRYVTSLQNSQADFLKKILPSVIASQA